MSLKRGGFVYTCDYCGEDQIVSTDELPPGWGTVQIFLPSFDRTESDRKYSERYGDTYCHHVCNGCIDRRVITVTFVRSRQLSLMKERGYVMGGVEGKRQAKDSAPGEDWYVGQGKDMVPNEDKEKIMGMDDELYGKGI